VLVKHSRRRLHVTPDRLLGSPPPSRGQALVEGWVAILTRRRLQRGEFASTADREATIQATYASGVPGFSPKRSITSR
jgi:hypothetical protein